jgi:hypothetical protein
VGLWGWGVRARLYILTVYCTDVQVFRVQFALTMGQAGVEKMIQNLNDDMLVEMRQIGVGRPSDLSPKYVSPPLFHLPLQLCALGCWFYCSLTNWMNNC